MQRYFTDKELSAGKVYTSDSDTHHMKNVMRFKPGQEFHMVDITRTAFLCEVTKTDDHVHYRVVSAVEESPELPVRTSIVCPLLKGEKFEWMIQKSTELGAFDFHIFEADRSVVKLEARKRAKRLERYSKIIREAGEQSRRNMIPHINFGKSLKNTDFEAFDAVIFAYEGNSGNPATGLNRVFKKLGTWVRIALVLRP